MENITIQDILEATDGTLLCGDPSMKIDHLSTNSMEIGPNTLFVPIIGERVDAHIFIPNALKEGGACLTQKPGIFFFDEKGKLLPSVKGKQRFFSIQKLQEMLHTSKFLIL